MVLAKLFVAGWPAFFALTIGVAQAQTVNPVPPPPPPVFNPSTPNTVPQPRETPVSPATLGALPGANVLVPSQESPVSPDDDFHRRAVISAKVKPKVAKTRRHRMKRHHHLRSVTAPGPSYHTPSYYYPFTSGYGPYGCVWRREWDGNWVHSCL